MLLGSVPSGSSKLAQRESAATLLVADEADWDDFHVDTAPAAPCRIVAMGSGSDLLWPSGLVHSVPPY